MENVPCRMVLAGSWSASGLPLAVIRRLVSYQPSWRQVRRRGRWPLRSGFADNPEYGRSVFFTGCFGLLYDAYWREPEAVS